jgi:hypothetical protein
VSREPEVIGDSPEVDAVFNRMCEIIGKIASTTAPSARIEYSALLCAACFVISADQGMPSTRENLSRLLHMVIRKVNPAIEAELERPGWN